MTQYRNLLILFLILNADVLKAQTTIEPPILNRRWEAQWISHPTSALNAYGVYYFRKIFNLKEVPGEFIVHVSADNRYELYVNGERVLLGPAWGDLHHWRFDTKDIASFLRPGRNIISARVVNFGHKRAVSQFSYKTGFILQGNSDLESFLNTGKDSWEVIKDEAYQPIFIDFTVVDGYYAANPSDLFDVKDHLWKWKEINNDYEWLKPGGVSNASNYGTPRQAGHYFNDQAPWLLVPRNIPPMEETEKQFKAVERTEGIQITSELLQGRSSFVVPAESKVSILLDQEIHTRGYPQVGFSDGKGSKIKITYAEGLYDAEGNKGNRDDVEGKEIKGYYDLILPDGGKGRTYRSLWHRVFRYVQLDIETGKEALVVDSLSYTYTAYPYQLRSAFETDDPDHKALFKLGWQTLRSGTGEVFEDGPYYEQIMYGGDARITSLVSLYMSGDERMTRNIIDLFDNSRMPEGLTYSRYPSNIVQINPQYSLCWIQIIHDYMRYTNDTIFARNYLDGMDAVLKWHVKLIDDTGMLGEVPWLRHIENKSRTPMHPERGHSAQQTLFLAYTLDKAAEIHSFYKNENLAKEYLALSATLKEATYRNCWNGEKGLLGDTPEKDVYTMHANALGILTDAIPLDQQPAVMSKVLNDSTLMPAYLFFHFWIFEALDKCGMGNEFLDQIGYWKKLLDYGFTTMPEFQIESRSDCHAWSTHVNYYFLTTVAGIKLQGFGSNHVVIQPQPGDQKRVSALVPLSQGKLSLDLQKKRNKVVIDLPARMTGEFLWKEKQWELKPGVQEIKL